jgi:hypothetical protein
VLLLLLLFFCRIPGSQAALFFISEIGMLWCSFVRKNATSN